MSGEFNSFVLICVVSLSDRFFVVGGFFGTIHIYYNIRNVVTFLGATRSEFHESLRQVYAPSLFVDAKGENRPLLFVTLTPLLRREFCRAEMLAPLLPSIFRGCMTHRRRRGHVTAGLPQCISSPPQRFQTPLG